MNLSTTGPHDLLFVRPDLPSAGTAATRTSGLGTWRHRLLLALCVCLAASFLVGAVTKFSGGPSFFGPSYAVKFVEWGYPSWMRFVVGTGELVGGLALLVPARRFIGAAMLAVITAGATLTHVINHNPISESVAAPVTMALALTVVFAVRPTILRELWNPPVRQPRSTPALPDGRH